MELDPTLAIRSTEDWNARKVVRVFEVNRPVGVIVHHTASANRTPKTGDAETATASALAQAIQADHMDRNNWADSGQNFTISRGGVVLEGRTGSLKFAKKGFVTRGAHAGDNIGNRLYYGIEIEGNNEQSFKVTDQQWTALVELCAWLSSAGEYQSSNIRGHQTFVQTACPGKLMDHLDRLRKEVRERKIQILEQEGVTF